MRYDKNYVVFAKDPDWVNFVKCVGYVPTDKASEEAKKAMENYNSYTFPEWYKKDNNDKNN